MFHVDFAWRTCKLKHLFRFLKVNNVALHRLHCWQPWKLCGINTIRFEEIRGCWLAKYAHALSTWEPHRVSLFDLCINSCRGGTHTSQAWHKRKIKVDAFSASVTQSRLSLGCSKIQLDDLWRWLGSCQRGDMRGLLEVIQATDWWSHDLCAHGSWAPVSWLWSEEPNGIAEQNCINLRLVAHRSLEEKQEAERKKILECTHIRIFLHTAHVRLFEWHG